jgi:ferric-dicitrate binding protein FerR (iron transport regulator)
MSDEDVFGGDQAMDPTEARKIEMKRRRDEERRQAEEEREEHLAQLQEASALRKMEVDELMDGLKDPERRAIRLEAISIALRAGLLSVGAANSQTILDDLTLRLTRYAVKGEA